MTQVTDSTHAVTYADYVAWLKRDRRFWRLMTILGAVASGVSFYVGYLIGGGGG